MEAPQMSSFTRTFDSNVTLRSPTNTPQLLQSHLYEAFLSGETADISLRVSGSWNAVYRLHRIVLTQAGFFRSLFTSGFMEGSLNASIAQGEVRMRFDHDPNITRTAFEICLARLYGGGGPPLYVCPSLKPTPMDPLTAAYMRPWMDRPSVPKGHQPATPRFLLSLLSTAFYLSIPNLASEVLHLILGSIGPTTVIRYLDFALGKGIGQPDAVESDRAVTLEHIGQDVDSSSMHTTRTDATYDSYTAGEDDDISELKSGEISTSDGPNSQSSPEYLYGVVSNKIGESCAAFLTRWGVDMLVREEDETASRVASPKPLYSDKYTPVSFVHASSSSSTLTWRPTAAPPRIWSQGLSPEWVYSVISSDEFFVKSEQGRYDVAKRVVEMRRRVRGIVPDEETQWSRLFEEGIYYSHFSWNELVTASEDRSPINDSPYVSLGSIQAAHWDSDMLRQLILKQDTLRGPGRPTSGSSGHGHNGLDLGLKIDFSDPNSINGIKKRSLMAPYWPIPMDTSLRIGETGNTVPSEGFFTASTPHSSRRSVAAHNFFGIGSPRRTGDAILSDQSISRATSNPQTTSHWVAYQPFRFSVEFWGADSLKERTRLHSQTVFYAGSCYNVYTQAVRKKGLQLGVYLHRQSNVDPIPAASAPRSSSIKPPPSSWPLSLPNTSNMTPVPTLPMAVTGTQPYARSVPSSEASSSRGNTPGPVSRSPLHRSTTPMAVPRSPRMFHSHYFAPSSPPAAHTGSPNPQSSIGLLSNASQHFSSTPVPPNQPYRDPRPAISAYFSIACHSATGSNLTRFSSAPDMFAVSQSWGWKSSSLDVGEFGDEQDAPESSLRATVVIGLV